MRPSYPLVCFLPLNAAVLPACERLARHLHGPGLHTRLLVPAAIAADKRVRLLHVLGTPEELSEQALGAWLQRFPRLQGVVLQGCARPETLEGLFKADLAVLVLPEEAPWPAIMGWYRQLQQGQSLRAAVKAWTGSPAPRLLPVSYDLAENYWGWEGKSPRLTAAKLPVGFFFLDENLPAVSQPLRLHRAMPMPAASVRPVPFRRPTPQYAAVGLLLGLLATGLTLYSLLSWPGWMPLGF